MSILLLILVIIGLFTTAFMLSVISKVYRKPINLLRGDKSGGSGKKPYGIGKGSIIVQFTFSVILIISSILITRQVKHLLGSDVGYNTDNVVQVKLQNI